MIPTIFFALLILLGPLQKDTSYRVKFLFSFPEKPILAAPLSQPQAIAIDPDGTVFVSDTGNNRIIKFDQNGHYIFAIGGFGWEIEQFDQPVDVAAKTGLEIFVADYNNERIQRYDKKLNYISSLHPDETLSNTLQFGFPGGIDISSQGELFICDTENNRILKLNTLGDPVLSFGDFNWGEGQLEHPVKVEVTPDNLVYVSDQESNQIVMFDYYGTYMTRFGDDQLSNPNGMTLWTDKLLVADSGNDRLAVFNKNHEFVYSWGEKGVQFGAFDGLVDVATFKNRIYVLDSGNNRVQVFELISNDH